MQAYIKGKPTTRRKQTFPSLENMKMLMSYQPKSDHQSSENLFTELVSPYIVDTEHCMCPNMKTSSSQPNQNTSNPGSEENDLPPSPAPNCCNKCKHRNTNWS